MHNLYDPATADEIKDRLGRLSPQSAALWGRMSAAQTVTHCAISMEWAVGDRVPPRMFWAGLLGRAIKGKVLGDEAPFRRNSPTSPDLVVRGDPDFEGGRARLTGLIERFAAAGPERCTQHPHSFFGCLTAQEWAILTYKHLDHHLRQFGV